MRAIISILSLLLVACGGNGGGNDDTSTDEPGDTADAQGDTSSDPVPDTADDTAIDTATDSAPDDSTVEPECAADGDCDDSDPCTADTCDVGAGTCGHAGVDADGDGHAAMAAEGVDCAGGTDCDDTEEASYPGAPETGCDFVDSDCDGSVDEWIDDDGDDWIDVACSGAIADPWPFAGLGDCDDTDDHAYPGSPESCTDGIDQDCDGVGDCHAHEECGTSGRCEIRWVTLSAAAYTMGSPVGEPGHWINENQHTVTLTHSFEIQAVEVTQSQFASLMGYQTACDTACGGDCPVECITWNEAAAYCNALSSSEGYGQCYTCSGSGEDVSCAPNAAFSTPYDCPGYRLPTEAEWEYAARAGTTEGTYNGTSTLTDCTTPNAVLDPIAWYCGNSGDMIHEVGGKSPNAWGLYDVLGNVMEMCQDWYGVGTGEYPGDQTDPWGPSSGTHRMKRGGCWSDDAVTARSAQRNCTVPPDSTPAQGFRPVLTLP